MVDILLEIILDLVNSNYTDWLTLFVLILTLWYVRKYTIAAKEQTAELIRQRRLSYLPSFVPSMHYNLIPDMVQGNVILTLSNVGNGLAVNVLAHNFELPDGTIITFNLKNFIKKDEVGHLAGFHDIEKNPDGPWLNQHFFKIGDAESTYAITIRFQDIEGN